MPRDLKQLRSLLGGLSHYRTFLPNISKRVRPITALKKGVKFLCTLSMEVIVRAMLAELAPSPVLVSSDWHVVEDGSRPFCVYLRRQH